MSVTPSNARRFRHGAGTRRNSRIATDVAIAEQHAVTFAADAAIGGYKPVVAIPLHFHRNAPTIQVIYMTSLSRKLPVMFAIDRARRYRWRRMDRKRTGARSISLSALHPDMVIMTPSGETNVARCYLPGIYNDGPTAVRYPHLLCTGRGALPPAGKALW